MTLLEAEAALTALCGGGYCTIRAEVTRYRSGKVNVAYDYYTERLSWSNQFPTIDALLADARMAMEDTALAENDIELTVSP